MTHYETEPEYKTRILNSLYTAQNIWMFLARIICPAFNLVIEVVLILFKNVIFDKTVSSYFSNSFCCLMISWIPTINFNTMETSKKKLPCNWPWQLSGNLVRMNRFKPVGVLTVTMKINKVSIYNPQPTTYLSLLIHKLGLNS